MHRPLLSCVQWLAMAWPSMAGEGRGSPFFCRNGVQLPLLKCFFALWGAHAYLITMARLLLCPGPALCGTCQLTLVLSLAGAATVLQSCVVDHAVLAQQSHGAGLPCLQAAPDRLV